MPSDEPKTQAALAAKLGVSTRTIRSWASSPEWKFHRKGPFVLAEVLQWRDKHRRMAQHGGTSPKGRAAWSTPAGHKAGKSNAAGRTAKGNPARSKVGKPKGKGRKRAGIADPEPVASDGGLGDGPGADAGAALDNGLDGGPDATPVKSAIEQDQSLKEAREVHQRLQTDILREKFVPRELLDTALAAVTDLFISELEQLVPGLPPQLYGKEPHEIERMIDDRVATIRDRLHQKLVAAEAEKS